MGRLLKAAVLILGLVALGSGSWIIGVACLLYLLVSSKPKSVGSSPLGSVRGLVGQRTAVFIVLAFLGLLAFASGGTFSPIVFISLAILLYFWPHLSPGLRLSVIPVNDSILLRSRFLPFAWHAIAEVKPGSEEIPRALSSFAGRLLITKEGRAFTCTTVLAFDFRSAQKAVDAILKESADAVSEGGAYLLPVDSKTACEDLTWDLTPLKSKSAPFPAAGASVIVLESERGVVKRACAYKAANSLRAPLVLPGPGKTLERELLLWEVLQSFGKAHPWQEPDSFSSLLQSIHATASEPIAQRFNAIDGTEESVTVQTLGGDQVPLSRAQLRAIVAMYS